MNDSEIWSTAIQLIKLWGRGAERVALERLEGLKEGHSKKDYFAWQRVVDIIRGTPLDD